jgi:predicted dehydrogenase
MTLRLGLVGVGAICRNRILPAIAGNKSWKVAAAFDSNPQALSGLESEFGVEKTCTELDALYDNKLDAVYIATPNRFHSIHALRAMNEGAAVLVEKPCADTLANAIAIANCSARTGRPALVGYMSKFNRYNRKAIELVHSGLIGRVRAMSSGFGFISRETTGWRFLKSLSGMGVMGDLMTYQVATMTDLFGESGGVCRAIACPARDDTFTDRTVVADIRLHNEVMVHLDASFDRDTCYYTLVGDEGSIEVSNSWYQGGGGRISLWNADGRREFHLEEVNPYAEEFEYFHKVILGQEDGTLLSAARAVTDIKFLDAFVQSAARNGEEVLIPQVTLH